MVTIKWASGNKLVGKNVIPMPNIPEKVPHILDKLLNILSLLFSLKKQVIAEQKNIYVEFIIINAKLKRICETIFVFPVGDSVRPKSLKKFVKKEYPEVFGLISVPPE